MPYHKYSKCNDSTEHVKCHASKHNTEHRDSEIRHDMSHVTGGGGLFGSHAYHYTGLSTLRTFIYVLLVNCCIINKRLLRQVRLSGWQPVKPSM